LQLKTAVTSLVFYPREKCLFASLAKMTNEWTLECLMAKSTFGLCLTVMANGTLISPESSFKDTTSKSSIQSLTALWLRVGLMATCKNPLKCGRHSTCPNQSVMIMLKSNLLLKKMIMVTAIRHLTRRWILATIRLITTLHQTKMKMNKQLMGCVTAIKFISCVLYFSLVIKSLSKLRF